MRLVFYVGLWFRFVVENYFFCYSENLDVLKCEKCLRVVGLWLFECMFYENKDEVKSVLDKIINAIEFANEKYYYYEYSKPVDNGSSIILTNKRKLDVFLVSIVMYFVVLVLLYFSFKNDDDEGIENKRIRKKYFNPIDEHYAWCPWRQVFNQDKNACQLNNEIIYKYLINSKKVGLIDV
jgi:hypothetical protein